MTQRKQYPQLDLMKLFMAVLVVMIHTEPFVIVRGQFLSELYDDILRLAVPFFFMTSGFLLGKKCLGADKKRIGAVLASSIRRNLRLYLLWSLIYLPAAVVGYVRDGVSLLTGIVHYVVSLVAVGEHFYSWHLWFLLAMVYGLIGMLVLNRFMGIRGICAVSLGIFLAAHMIDGIYRGTPLSDIPGVLLGHFAHPLIIDGPARILTGMCYMAMGWLLAEKEPAMSWKPLCAVFVLTLLLSAWAGWWPVSLVNHGIFFLLVLKLQVRLEKPVAQQLRRSSTVIYFVHMLFFFIWFLLHGCVETTGIAGFLCTLGGSAGACAIVLRMDRRAHQSPVIKALF